MPVFNLFIIAPQHANRLFLVGKVLWRNGLGGGQSQVLTAQVTLKHHALARFSSRLHSSSTTFDNRRQIRRFQQPLAALPAEGPEELPRTEWPCSQVAPGVVCRVGSVGRKIQFPSQT
jgi:hypothetical protein